VPFEGVQKKMTLKDDAGSLESSNGEVARESHNNNGKREKQEPKYASHRVLGWGGGGGIVTGRLFGSRKSKCYFNQLERGNVWAAKDTGVKKDGK